MNVALPRLALRAFLAGAAVVAVVLLWGMQQADAKQPPPLLDLGGGGLGIDVPPIGPIDIPPINVGGGPAGQPGGGGGPSATTPTPGSATPAPTGTPAADLLDGLLPSLDPSSPAFDPALDPTLGSGLGAVAEYVQALEELARQVVPPLAPIVDLVDQAVLSPLVEGLDRAVDQLVGPIVAVMPRAQTTSSASNLSTPGTPAPAAVPPPDPGAPATQSLTTDVGRGPASTGPPAGRAPPEPVGAPGPPLGTTGSTTTSGNGNRLDAGVLVLGFVLALLLGLRPRDEAWWYAGVYQLEPLTRPG